jgi:hypothetical protein
VVPARYGRQANLSNFVQPGLSTPLHAALIRLFLASTPVAFTHSMNHFIIASLQAKTA